MTYELWDRGSQLLIGSFDTEQEAISAYVDANGTEEYRLGGQVIERDAQGQRIREVARLSDLWHLAEPLIMERRLRARREHIQRRRQELGIDSEPGRDASN